MEPHGRLVLRSRRGMKELDVVLERWLERDLPSASVETVAAYVRLLELQDPDLAEYILKGRAHADDELATLIARIRVAA